MYSNCYSIDKKAYRRIKNILKRMVDTKLILTFVDEKKRSINLVIGQEVFFDSDRVE